MRGYLNHLVERKVSSPYFNVNVAALRFFHMVVLGQLGVGQVAPAEEAA